MIGSISEADLDAPSRCAGWSIQDLAEHMVGQNFGFAQAIAHGDAGLAAYEPRPLAQWDDSASALTSAIAQPATMVALAEFGPGASFPLESVLAFHTLDLAVHTWDALGDAFRPSGEVTGLVLAVAERLPPRTDSTGPFAPAVSSDGDQDQWRRALNLLGRHPGS